MGQAIEVASADEDLLKALSSLSAQGARLTGEKTRPIAYEPPLEGGVLSEFSLRPQENKCKHSCVLIPRDCPRCTSSGGQCLESARGVTNFER